MYSGTPCMWGSMYSGKLCVESRNLCILGHYVGGGVGVRLFWDTMYVGEYVFWETMCRE